MSTAPASVGGVDAPPATDNPVVLPLVVAVAEPDPPPPAEAPTSQAPKRPLSDREQLALVLRTVFWTVANWFVWIWKDDTSDNYEDDPEYQAAKRHYNELQLQEGVNYDTVVAFAKEMFSRYDATDKSLDEKAEFIVKSLGGGSALITLASILSFKTDTANAMILGIVAAFCFVPAMIAAMLAIIFAVRSRRPRASGGFPRGKWAFEMADFYKDEKTISVLLWLILLPKCEAAHFRAGQKAKLVKRAHVCYMWAIGLLIVPLVGSATALISMLPK